MAVPPGSRSALMTVAERSRAPVPTDASPACGSKALLDTARLRRRSDAGVRSIVNSGC